MQPPSILFTLNFITDHSALFDALMRDVQWDERIQARKTACFGVAYNYSNMSYPTVPMHPQLSTHVELLETRLGYRPNNCLLNYYSDGNSRMGFHSDSEQQIVPGTGVAIISLGSERRITFRRKADRKCEHAFDLPPGSLLYMPPGIQQDWEHGIPKSEDSGPRISLTFRQLLAPD